MLLRLSPLLLAWLSTVWASNLARPQQHALNADHASKEKLNLTHDLIGFHKSLVEIESITDNEQKVGDWLAASLQAQGYSVEKQYLSKDSERFNVLAWPGSKRDAKVLVTSHIDTVPPFIPYKFEKFADNNTISGRGSVDAKGSVATQVIAINNLVSSSRISADDVAVLFVVGEETGGDGMKAANKLSLYPSFVIFGEPTERKLISGHKGTMRINIHAKGRAAHSGYPWLGRSANEVLIAALAPIVTLGDHLPQSEKYGKTTLNIGKIAGGVASNVVAESATAEILVRIAEGSPKMIQEEVTNAVHLAVKPFLSGPDGGQKQHLKFDDIIEINAPGAGYGVVDIDHDIPGFDVMTVNYGTDIPNWKVSVKGQKRYLYGPGTIFVAHSDHEALTEKELHAAVNGYERIILHVLEQESDYGDIKDAL